MSDDRTWTFSTFLGRIAMLPKDIPCIARIGIKPPDQDWYLTHFRVQQEYRCPDRNILGYF